MAGRRNPVNKSLHLTTGYYKRRILVIQENFKLFSVIAGVLSLIALPINLVNAAAGGISLGVSIAVNVIWLGFLAFYLTYLALGEIYKKKYFKIICETLYSFNNLIGDRCLVVNGENFIRNNELVKVYDERNNYVVVAYGLDEIGSGLWTKYDFKRDFGVLLLNKGEYTLENDGKTLTIFNEEKKFIFNIGV